MWWVPLIAAFFMALVVTVFHLFQHARQVKSSKLYRSKFQQLVVQLETVTRHVTQLEVLARSVRDPRLFDYYESTLRILETLLVAIRRLPPFGSEPSNLDSAFYLIKDTRERVARTQHAFQEALRGRQVKLEELYGSTSFNAAQVRRERACYFCSRPMEPEKTTQVRVKIDGDVRQVAGCYVCRAELENTKKIKVLYFMRDGKPTHWSEIHDYQPHEDYWGINEKRLTTEATRQSSSSKLELVFSNAGKPLSRTDHKSSE